MGTFACLFSHPVAKDKRCNRITRNAPCLSPEKYTQLAQSLILRYTEDVIFRTRVPQAVENHATIFREAPRFMGDDGLYRDHFERLDGTIAKLYEDRWGYHDKKVAASPTEWNGEHFTIGTMDTYGNAPKERDVRAQFAIQVFRLRTDQAVKDLLASHYVPTPLKQAGAALEKVKSYTIPVSAEKDSGQFRVGYDPLSDNSKVEYESSRLKGGVYYPRLLGSLMGGGMNQLRVSLQGNLGQGKSSASLTYHLAASRVEAGIAQPISSMWSANLASRISLHADDPAGMTYNLSFTYRF